MPCPQLDLHNRWLNQLPYRAWLYFQWQSIIRTGHMHVSCGWTATVTGRLIHCSPSHEIWFLWYRVWCSTAPTAPDWDRRGELESRKRRLPDPRNDTHNGARQSGFVPRLRRTKVVWTRQFSLRLERISASIQKAYNPSRNTPGTTLDNWYNIGWDRDLLYIFGFKHLQLLGSVLLSSHIHRLHSRGWKDGFWHSENPIFPNPLNNTSWRQWENNRYFAFSHD